MDHLPVDQGGAAGHGGEQPEEEQYFQLVVEREPETEQDVGNLLRDGDDGEHYPVRHPVDVVLKRDLTAPAVITLKLTLTFFVLTALKEK